MKTRDSDIRRSLNEQLKYNFKDDSSTLIINELCLCQGDVRADVAVINGAIHGYEIKSDSDTLERLPKQIEFYNKVFDTITVVTGDIHFERVKSMIPKWWGICLAKVTNDSTNVTLETFRETLPNKNVEAISLIQFLWREELLEILRQIGATKEIYKYRKFELWDYLCENVSLEEIKSYVRAFFKKRNNWRVD